MTLHIFKTHKQFDEKLKLISGRLTNDDAVILIENAIYVGCNPINLMTKVYALSEDIDARDMKEKIGARVEVVNYDGFVALTEAHEKVITW